MTLESFLSRELDIRFIDARRLTTEAKLKLGILGYPTQDERERIIEEAVLLFNQHSSIVQTSMRHCHNTLENLRSLSSSSINENDSLQSPVSDRSDTSVSSRRTVKLSGTRRKPWKEPI